MELSEITVWWMAYRKSLKLARENPEVEAYAYMAAKALAQVVACQAQYFSEVHL